MKNLKVSAKLISGFLVVIVLALVVGIVGIVGMSSLSNAASEMYNSNLIAIQAMGNLRELFANERNDIRSMFLTQDDPQAVQSTLAKFDGYAKTAKENFDLYEMTITDESAESAYYAARDAYLGPFAALKVEVFALINAGRFDEAYSTFAGGAAVIQPITAGLSTGTEQNDKWAQEANADATSLFTLLTWVLVGVLAFVVFISFVLAMYISGLISKPLKILTTFMNKAGSTGDITLSAEDIKLIGTHAQSKDEIGQCIGSTAAFVEHINGVSSILETIANNDLTPQITLLSEKDTMGLSLEKMLESLNRMFNEIHASSSQVSTGSKQIADGAQSLAQGSTEQASAVEQLSSSINDIANKTNQNAEIAKEAADLSGVIRGNAETGNSQMEKLMQAVKEINDASQSIGKVIKVIDDIAFQTNILALNAAVEAARAGQHGKGFAVVAEEVRNLAAKSADAAKDTSGMIANSIEKANLGYNIATETSTSLKEIVEGINHSAEIVAQIARLSEEQSSATKQVNIGIDQVAQVVQQNSATAEESAAASQEMSGQSEMLEQLIAQFKLRDDNVNRLGARSAAPQRKALNTPGGNVDSDFGKY